MSKNQLRKFTLTSKAKCSKCAAYLEKGDSAFYHLASSKMMCAGCKARFAPPEPTSKSQPPEI